MRLTYFVFSFLLNIALLSVSQAAVILQYHHIDESTPAATSISPGIFEKQMAYISEHHFEVWPLTRLVYAIQQNKTLPDKVVAITFDDGYESVAKYALPILRKHSFPFTVFITPAMVGKNLFMDWETLKQLHRFGGSIANHTLNHLHMVRRRPDDTGGETQAETEAEWKERIHYEITSAEKSIKQHIGQSSGLFAYPYGEFNNQIKSIVQDLGMVAFAQHSGAFDRYVDQQEIPRFAFGGKYIDMEEFIDKINSLPMPLKSVSVKDERGNVIEGPLLPVDETKPTLVLELQSPDVASKLNCFATGQGRIDIQVKGALVTTQFEKDLPVGRSRINCTALSNMLGRYYWYSHFFMRKNIDGSWYEEP